jgi:hypothetical protein
MQVELNINPATWLSAIDGKKVYIGCAVSAAMVIANHFGYLPPQYVPAQMNAANWVGDLATIYFIATGRSALAKNGSIAALMNALQMTKITTTTIPDNNLPDVAHSTTTVNNNGAKP